MSLSASQPLNKPDLRSKGAKRMRNEREKWSFGGDLYSADRTNQENWVTKENLYKKQALKKVK